MSSWRCFGFGVSFFGVGEPAASAIAGRFSGLRAAWLVVDCFFCVILLLRLTARCRGSPRRRGELRKVWDLACGFVQATKNRSPPTLTVARFGVLLSQVSSSLAHA